MRERFIRTELAEYEVADWDGEPPSIKPLGDTVLILCDRLPEKSGGGILYANMTKEQMDVASESGTLVALGPDAWRYDMERTRVLPDEERAACPKVGDHVIFTRYSGVLRRRGEQYFRLMSDRCIGGIEEPEERSESAGVVHIAAGG